MYGAIVAQAWLDSPGRMIALLFQASPQAALKMQRLFKEMRFEDTDEYTPNIFTYSSQGFIRGKQAMKNHQQVDRDVISDPPELIYEDDDPEAYTFENF